MEYWHFTSNHLHVTDCSLYSWIKRHNLERECCNKPYNWKIAIGWYFTTRKSFLSNLAYWRPFIFHWLTRNQKQHFSFSKGSHDLFLIHWQIYEQAIHHQKHCSDRNQKRRGEGNDNPWSFLNQSDFDKCKIFQNMFSLQIQISTV